MCAVTISEYSNMLMLTGGHLPIVGEPSLRTQVLEVGDTSQVSEPFGPAVKFIRVHADEAVALKFGTNPVATSADARISANTTELFAVQLGQRVAAVAMDKGASMDSLTAVIELLGDPKAAQGRGAELKAATEASTKAAAEAKSATAKATQAQAVLAAKQHDLDTRVATLEAARQDLDAQAAKLATDREALDGKIAPCENRGQADGRFRKAARRSRYRAVRARAGRHASRKASDCERGCVEGC